MGGTVVEIGSQIHKNLKPQPQDRTEAHVFSVSIVARILIFPAEVL